MSPAYRTLALGACLLAAGSVAVSAQRPRPAAAMAEAARAFLGSLTPEQKQKATFSFGDEERFNWHFIPRARKGLPLKEMTEPQQKAALALLRAGLSEKGFDKAATIRELEKILKVVEMGRGPMRDHELYFFTVFGEPAAEGNWAWRYEGHHCALNWTIVRGRSVATSPQFFGSNPAEVRTDVPGAPGRGTKVLKAEEELARALVKALTPEQRAQAVLSPTAPPDIITGAQRKAAMQEDRGIAYSALTAEQKPMLMAVIQEYTSAQMPPLARARLERIRGAGLDGIKFAWMGSLEPNQGHYYRIQGPTFLIEYDNTQNNANHVHAVWRDFNGDFGQDLLALHYRTGHHRVASNR